MTIQSENPLIDQEYENKTGKLSIGCLWEKILYFSYSFFLYTAKLPEQTHMVTLDFAHKDSYHVKRFNQKLISSKIYLSLFCFLLPDFAFVNSSSFFPLSVLQCETENVPLHRSERPSHMGVEKNGQESQPEALVRVERQQWIHSFDLLLVAQLLFRPELSERHSSYKQTIRSSLQDRKRLELHILHDLQSAHRWADHVGRRRCQTVVSCEKRQRADRLTQTNVQLRARVQVYFVSSI